MSNVVRERVIVTQINLKETYINQIEKNVKQINCNIKLHYRLVINV